MPIGVRVINAGQDISDQVDGFTLVNCPVEDLTTPLGYRLVTSLTLEPPQPLDDAEVWVTRNGTEHQVYRQESTA